MNEIESLLERLNATNRRSQEAALRAAKRLLKAAGRMEDLQARADAAFLESARVDYLTEALDAAMTGMTGAVKSLLRGTQ